MYLRDFRTRHTSLLLLRWQAPTSYTPTRTDRPRSSYKHESLPSLLIVGQQPTIEHCYSAFDQVHVIKQRAMFGSSQDRARQLAGRTRRERMFSAGSHTSHGSFDTSSQAPQQPRAASLEQNIQRSSAVPECPSHESRLARAGRQTSQGSRAAQDINNSHLSFPITHDSAHPTSGRYCSQLEEARLQAEYLSQVLYDSVTPPTLANPPQSHFRVLPHHSRYGSLGTRSTTSHHLRNITEPIPTPRSSAELPAILHTRMGLSMLPPLQKSAFESHLQIQTPVSLRGGHGGAGEGDPPKSPPNAPPNGVEQEVESSPGLGMPLRSFMWEFTWIYIVHDIPEWEAPIASGRAYDSFLGSLSTQDRDRFRHLFDLRSPPTYTTGFVAVTARRTFYRTLTLPQKHLFKDVITMRGNDLLKLVPFVADPETKLKLQSVAPENVAKPWARLYFMLEATENAPRISLPQRIRAHNNTVVSSGVIPSPDPFNSGFGSSRIWGLRAISEPNLASRPRPSSFASNSLYLLSSALRLNCIVFVYHRLTSIEQLLWRWRCRWFDCLSSVKNYSEQIVRQISGGWCSGC